MFQGVFGSAAQTWQSACAAQASPLDAECEAEGKVVCHQGHIKGQPGAFLKRPFADTA